MIDKKVREYIKSGLLSEGSVVMQEICSLKIEPARKGKIYGTFGHTPKYKYRVSYKPSSKLKDLINMELERRHKELGRDATLEDLLKVL